MQTLDCVCFGTDYPYLGLKLPIVLPITMDITTPDYSGQAGIL
jgi:hypothetical protein